jgi:hypothetical protein
MNKINDVENFKRRKSFGTQAIPLSDIIKLLVSPIFKLSINKFVFFNDTFKVTAFGLEEDLKLLNTNLQKVISYYNGLDGADIYFPNQK